MTELCPIQVAPSFVRPNAGKILWVLPDDVHARNSRWLVRILRSSAKYPPAKYPPYEFSLTARAFQPPPSTPDKSRYRKLEIHLDGNGVYQDFGYRMSLGGWKFSVRFSIMSKTFSVSVRLQRVTIETTFVSVPLLPDLVEPNFDGSGSINGEK